MSSADSSTNTAERAVERTPLDWKTLLLLALMYALLLGNGWLYWNAPLPLLLHVAIATIAIHMAFTIWHEAAHKNVAGPLWANHLVGVLGMFPYVTPYFMQRWIHLEHHRKLNKPEDPNYAYLDGSFATIVLRYPRALGYAKKLLTKDPREPWQKLSDFSLLGVVTAIHLYALWQGWLLDLLLLWALPVVLAKIIMDWYVNYLPHVGLPPHRFLGTRIIDVSWFTPLILCHNYHAIHHLWPGIPWHRYPAVYREKLDYLREHRVPIEQQVFGGRSRPAQGEA